VAGANVAVVTRTRELVSHPRSRGAISLFMAGLFVPENGRDAGLSGGALLSTNKNRVAR
jgi:hypothetical protein